MAMVSFVVNLLRVRGFYLLFATQTNSTDRNYAGLKYGIITEIK